MMRDERGGKRGWRGSLSAAALRCARVTYTPGNHAWIDVLVGTYADDRVRLSVEGRDKL